MQATRWIASLILTLALGLVPVAAHGQSQHNYLVAGSIGFGGTSDADPDPDFDNLNLQALFGLRIDNAAYFTIRLGQLNLESDGDPAGLFDTDLTYLSLGGEYRFPESFYESGLFIGLGFYDLSGSPLLPGESGPGLSLGATGDFAINDHFTILGELAGHLVDLDYTNFFITVNVGLGYRF